MAHDPDTARKLARPRLAPCLAHYEKCLPVVSPLTSAFPWSQKEWRVFLTGVKNSSRLRFPDCEAFQISAAGKKNYRSPEGIWVCNALPFLNTLV